MVSDRVKSFYKKLVLNTGEVLLKKKIAGILEFASECRELYTWKLLLLVTWKYI